MKAATKMANPYSTRNVKMGDLSNCKIPKIDRTSIDLPRLLRTCGSRDAWKNPGVILP